MPTLKRILVPVDFSPCSRAALEYAAFLSEQVGASIEVLHIWALPRYIGPDVALQAFGERWSTLAEYARASAAKEMEEFLTPLQRQGSISIKGKIESGEPYSRILSLTKDHKFDLIVMGTHGRTGLGHVFLGSVAERVVRRSPCPVLTIRLPDEAASERAT